MSALVYGIEPGDFYKLALLVSVGYAIFLVGYLLDRKHIGAERIRVAARTSVHLLMVVIFEHLIREEGFTHAGLAILAVMAALSIVLNRVLPKAEDPDESYFERLPPTLPNLEAPHFAGRSYEPGISPFA